MATRRMATGRRWGNDAITPFPSCLDKGLGAWLTGRLQCKLSERIDIRRLRQLLVNAEVSASIVEMKTRSGTLYGYQSVDQARSLPFNGLDPWLGCFHGIEVDNLKANTRLAPADSSTNYS